MPPISAADSSISSLERAETATFIPAPASSTAVFAPDPASAARDERYPAFEVLAVRHAENLRVTPIAGRIARNERTILATVLPGGRPTS